MKVRNYYFANNLFKGFTLIELLVAVAVLAIAVLVTAYAFIMTSKIRALAYQRSVAVHLAQDKLEEIKNLSYADSSLTDIVNNWSADSDSDSIVDFYDADADGDDILDGDPLDGDVSIDYSEEDASENKILIDGMFSRVWNIADDAPSSGLKTISVIVSWEIDSVPYEVILTTLKTQGF